MWTRKRFADSILSVSIIVISTAFAGTLNARADSSNGVLSVLQKKYLVTETTPDKEQLTKNGTTMAMKSAGIYTLPTSDVVVPDTKVANGKVQSPSMFVRLTWTKIGAHVLQEGDKVYITKMDSKTEGGSDVLQFTVLTVDSLDAQGQSSQKKYEGNISFKFKRGYLSEAAPEDVEQAVEAVFAPDDSGDSQGGDNSTGGDASQGDQQGAPAGPAPAPQPVAAPPPPPPAPAGPPPTIKIGESSTEVLQSMGMPLQMIDLGKKKTFLYKNMKIIFLNDKVSDVQ